MRGKVVLHTARESANQSLIVVKFDRDLQTLMRSVVNMFRGKMCGVIIDQLSHCQEAPHALNINKPTQDTKWSICIEVLPRFSLLKSTGHPEHPDCHTEIPVENQWLRTYHKFRVSISSFMAYLGRKKTANIHSCP